MKERAYVHRVEKQPPFPPTEPDDESERKSTARTPSTAIACVAQFRERYLTPEAISMLRAMTPDVAKEVCVNVLRALGFTVTLKTLADPKRNRSWEMRRSEARAKARAEKVAACRKHVDSQPEHSQTSNGIAKAGIDFAACFPAP